MRLIRRIMAGVCAAILVTASSACGAAIAVHGQAQGPTIAIGVSADEPGLGWRHDGVYQGFEIEVARYVAKALGYASKQIVFVPVTPSIRSVMLDHGVVDMVVSGYPMDARQSEDVALAGPYLTVGQTMMTLRGASAKADIAAMDGRTVCVAQGVEVAHTIRDSYPKVQVQERATYPQCVTAVLAGQADAMAGADVVLQGLRQANSGNELRVSSKAFATQCYGIAVRHDDTQLAQTIDDIIHAMIADGSWAKYAESLQERTGLSITDADTPATAVSHSE